PVIQAQSGPLALALRDAIYARCFARPFADFTTTDRAESIAGTRDGIARRFSAANHGSDGWLTGWSVVEIGEDRTLVVAKGKSRLTCRPGDYVMTFYEDMPPRAGCAVTVCHRKESFTLQDGVYYAFGNSLAKAEDEACTLRIYFNASQEPAVAIFEVMTSELNRQHVPFTLKSMLRAQDQDRADATLLYIPATRYLILKDLLEKFSSTLQASLKPGVPLFTKRLRDGVGLAESPTHGESFGMHRSRLVAEACVDAWLDGAQDARTRLAYTETRFEAEGLSLARPYLNPGSRDVYEI
ncbi:MAG TPA: T3SS effector HopA1 family protein, partial [Blastocatellia bacterium]|nr:T3SS effector HopA1 family protein [Blastocatellia bacterium]